MNLNWLAQASTGAQLVASIVIALYALASALSAFLGFVGAFYPPALKWAAAVSKVGLELHQVGNWLGSLLPASMAAKAARAAAKVAPPLVLFLVVGGLGFGSSGCTKQQGQQVVSVVATGLSDADKACLAIEAALPLLGLPAPTVAEADDVCKIVGVADQEVQSFLNTASTAVSPAVLSAKKVMALHAAAAK